MSLSPLSNPYPRYREEHSLTIRKEWGYFLRAFSASASPARSFWRRYSCSRFTVASSRLSFISYPSSTSTEVSKKSAISMMSWMSGTESPASHL